RRDRDRDRGKADKDRERDRDKPRDRDREKQSKSSREHDRDRERRKRSVSKERRTRKSKSRSRSRSREKLAKLVTRKPVTSEEFKDPTEEEAEMMKLMGFGSFDSTKGKHVQGNEEPLHGTVQVVLKRKYRQYMNRKGGFNRPLDPIA
ncbi:Uncharacterized protein APZ42_002188, partial [Daphnia magna]